MERKDGKRDSLRALQLCELKLIHMFVNICEQEQLLYYMIGGTMLGAVRHHGYIPWDDDADFGMPRTEYEKFINIAEQYLPNGIKLSKVGDADWENSDKPYQIRLIDTSVKFERKASKDSFITNAWIDIFPLDEMPNGKLLNRIYHTKILFLIKLYGLSRFETGVLLNNTHRNPAVQLAVKFCMHVPIYRLFSATRQWHILDKELKRYSCKDSEWLFNAIGAVGYREKFKKTIFGKNSFYQFEDIKLRGPEKYDDYLRQLYGDYMIPPPESERNQHGIDLSE